MENLDEELTQLRPLDEFCTLVEHLANSDVGKKSKVPSESLGDRFWREAVPLSRLFRNYRFLEGSQIRLATDGNAEDAVMHLPNATRKDIQIVTTYDVRMAFTEEHLLEFGYAFGPHNIQTRQELSQWREDKKPVLPTMAANTRLNIELELVQVVERIKTKVNKNYSPGMTLLVYSYLDHTEEHFSPNEIRAKILAHLSDVSLKDFPEIFLGQPRRVVRIK